jgi:hypothetical protein
MIFVSPEKTVASFFALVSLQVWRYWSLYCLPARFCNSLRINPAFPGLVFQCYPPLLGDHPPLPEPGGTFGLVSMNFAEVSGMRDNPASVLGIKWNRGDFTDPGRLFSQ